MTAALHSKWLVLVGFVLLPGCTTPRAKPSPLVATKPDPAMQRVYITVQADAADATLVETHGGRDTSVCVAPCNRTLNVGQALQYRVMGSQMMPTRTFGLYSPQDPVAWLDVEATKKSTHALFRGIFLTTIITGGVCTLAGIIATPIVTNESVRTGVSAVGFSGLVLMLPVGSVLGLLTNSYSQSNVKFHDPMTRPDLRELIR